MTKKGNFEKLTMECCYVRRHLQFEHGGAGRVIWSGTKSSVCTCNE
jgi:hypothetical protein